MDGPRRHRLCQNEVVADLKQRGPSVEQISRIGMDTSKHFFQLHGVNAAEKVVLRKKLRRKEMVVFFEALAPTVIGIEACGASHHWARILRSFGHEVKLIAPQLVKPYVKRGNHATLSTGNRRPEFTVPTKTSPRLQSLSVIATPPARRLPVRTAIGFWDPPTVARALRYGAPARRSKLSCLSPHTSRTSLRCDGKSSRRLLLCAVERFQGLNGLLYPFFDRGKHGEHRFVMGKDGTHRFVLVG